MRLEGHQEATEAAARVLVVLSELGSSAHRKRRSRLADQRTRALVEADTQKFLRSNRDFFVLHAVRAQPVF